MLRTDDLEFDLPESLIATEPAEPRDSARLMVLSRSDPGRLEHRLISDLPELLGAGDTLVLNTTRVLQARFVGENVETGGRVQGLYLRDGAEPATWVVLLKARRHRAGAVLSIGRPGSEDRLRAVLLGPAPDEAGAWLVRVEGDVAEALDRIGLPPLPPYILNASSHRGTDRDADADRDRYQTVYADEPGSVAAPTAGLHFTPELLRTLAESGVRRADVTLHVGTGTFKPVESAYVEEHPMHAERCSMAAGVLASLDAARSAGGRVIAVGTTSCRTIESFSARSERGEPDHGGMETDLLITPGYRWRVTDGLLTNFHLPRSTLLAMVGALLPGGVGRLREVYDEAICARYRFYSFGDAMLILP
ncbi:MAG: tRNA preQ1(34) S-adenosylmethionine ribosyltransferase-isomerase QueA [Planctomycetota bacterium]